MEELYSFRKANSKNHQGEGDTEAEEADIEEEVIEAVDEAIIGEDTTSQATAQAGRREARAATTRKSMEAEDTEEGTIEVATADMEEEGTEEEDQEAGATTRETTMKAATGRAVMRKNTDWNYTAHSHEYSPRLVYTLLDHFMRQHHRLIKKYFIFYPHVQCKHTQSLDPHPLP